MTRRRKKHRPDEIVAKLRDADAPVGEGEATVWIPSNRMAPSRRRTAGLSRVTGLDFMYQAI